jgi:alpha-ribazole phosphatase
MVKRLYLLRHGRVDTGGRYIGSTDLPLLQEGREDLAAVAPYLRRQNFDSVLCSPLLRCRQSLEVLDLDVRSEICPELREIDFGAWEGLTFSEILQRDPLLVEKWAVWSEGFRFPGGEGIGTFLDRIKTIRRRVETDPGERLLIISHGGVIRQLVCSCLGLGPENYLAFDIQPGLCSVIDLHPQGGVLVGLNQGK